MPLIEEWGTTPQNMQLIWGEGPSAPLTRLLNGDNLLKMASISIGFKDSIFL